MYENVIQNNLLLVYRYQNMYAKCVEPKLPPDTAHSKAAVVVMGQTDYVYVCINSDCSRSWTIKYAFTNTLGFFCVLKCCY